MTVDWIYNSIMAKKTNADSQSKRIFTSYKNKKVFNKKLKLQHETIQISINIGPELSINSQRALQDIRNTDMHNSTTQRVRRIAIRNKQSQCGSDIITNQYHIRIVNVNLSPLSETGTQFDDDDSTTQAKSHAVRRAEALVAISGLQYPQTFSLREQQLSQISRFVGECERGEGVGYRFMMVTGAPGMGKTLCLSHVLRTAKVPVISLNANNIRSLSQVQEIIYQKLMGKSCRGKSTDRVIRELSQQQSGPVLVYLQQIDGVLLKRGQQQCCEFMELFRRRDSGLWLIGVSNSIDAVEQYCRRNQLIMGSIRNIVFAPYSQEHLALLIEQKLQQLHQRSGVEVQLAPKLINFAAKKMVNTTKGDVRALNYFLRQLLVLLFAQYQDQQQLSFTPSVADLESIFHRMQHPKQQLVGSLPLVHRLILVGLMHIIKEEQALFVQWQRLKKAVRRLTVAMCKTSGGQWIQQLHAYGLIGIEKRGEERRVTLLVSSKDLVGCISQKERGMYMDYFQLP